MYCTAPDTTSESMTPSPVFALSCDDARSVLPDDHSVVARVAEQLLSVTPSPRDGPLSQWAQGQPLSTLQPTALLPCIHVCEPLYALPPKVIATGGAPSDIGSLTAKNIDQMIEQQHCIPSRTLWVGNVCSTVKKQEFKDLFGQYGDVQLIRHFPQSHCAFVTYVQSPAAVAALRGLEGRMVGSMKLVLTLGQASRHVWIGNVCGDISETELYTLCSQYGVVESFRILRVNQCAFINFYTIEDATRVADQLNGHELYGTKLVVNFQWATPNKRADAKCKAQGHGGKVRAISHIAAPTAHRKAVAPRMTARVEDILPPLSSLPAEQLSGANTVAVPSVLDDIAEPKHLEVLTSRDGTTISDQSSDKENEPEYPSYLLPPQPAQPVIRRQHDGSFSRPPRTNKPSPLPAVHIPLPEYPPNRQLYVGNISSITTEQTILTLFSTFGVVESVRWHKELFKCFCFVRYTDLATAQLVRYWMDVYKPVVDGKQLSIGYGKPPMYGQPVMSPEMQQVYQVQSQSWYATTNVNSPALSSVTSSPAPAYYQFPSFAASPSGSAASSLFASPPTTAGLTTATSSAMLASVSPASYGDLGSMFLQTPLQFPTFIDLSHMSPQALSPSPAAGQPPNIFTSNNWLLPDPVYPLLQRLTSGPHSLLRPADLENPSFNYTTGIKGGRVSSAEVAPNLLLTMEMQRQRQQQLQLLT